MATAHPDLTRGAFGGGGCDLDPRMDLSGREQQSHGEEEEEEEEEEAALDDLEPLDLDSMCASQGDSQETWLYITHSPDSGLSSITPLQWCRQTLDSPKLESTRRSLSSRLEQAPLTSPLHPHLLRTLSPVPRDLSPGPQDLSPMAERSPTFLSHLSKRSRSLQRAMFSPQSPVDPENPVCAEFKLQDLTDVQVMARMQEDSLRQELSLPRPRRSLSLSSFSGALSGHEEDESGDNCALLLPPAPPLSRLAHSHTLHNFHSLRNWPTAAAPPSPPPPSDGYGYSATGLETPQYTPLAYRRQASVSAPLRSGVGFGAPRPAAKATAYVSPTIKSPSYRPSPPSTPPHSPGASGLPPPRSALPRPASFSSRGKLGQSPRSFLTPPKSLSTLNALGDAGWRDGCY